MNAFYKVILLSFLSFLCGCQTVTNSGQLLTNQDIVNINSQHPSKEELVDMVGSPTYMPDYSDNTWYYIHRTSTKRSLFPRKTKKQQIVQITFSGNNALEARVVEDIEINDNLSINKFSTSSYGCGKTSIEKFVGNLGKFNSTSKKKK